MRLGFFGDGPWAHESLTRLLADDALQIAFVCARSDTPDPVLGAMAAGAGVPFVVSPNVNDETFRRQAAEWNCDLFVSMSFNQIFRRPLRTLPPLGTINCHAGKLPFYRGRNILNWALINDEREFGITVHHVDDGIDTGDIITQRCLPIADGDDYASLLERAHHGCADVLCAAIADIAAGRATRTPQASLHPVGFYCPQRRPGDEILDWRQPSRRVFNFIRAICRPGPEARTFREGAELRINRAEMVQDAPAYVGIPGTVIGVNPGSFTVKTDDSFVRITEWSGIERLRIGDRLRSS